MQPAVPLQIDEAEWDEHNLSRRPERGMTPSLVTKILSDEPLFRENQPDRTGDYLMIGSDSNGRFWTVVFIYLGEKRCRPISGWPSTVSQRHWYAQNQAQKENQDG